VLRGLIVYVFLILILRIAGKRQTGQLAPFDLVLLLVLSNAFFNSRNGGDNTVLGGLISASTLIALHYVVAFATWKSKTLESVIEGTPRIVIHDGIPDEKVLCRSGGGSFDVSEGGRGPARHHRGLKRRRPCDS
jgi:uncharacterized membrane protein YcaP (DUF421 family)